MERLTETMDLFQMDFKPKKTLKEINSEKIDGLHDYWRAFLSRFGVCNRKDGYLWIIDPKDYNWVNEIFDLSLIPVARDSFGNLFLTNLDGYLYSFLPYNRQLNIMSKDPLSSISFLGEKEFTDDKVLLKRHKSQIKQGSLTDYDTCYCFKPIIPLGGSESESEIYVGDIKTYLEIIAQATSQSKGRNFWLFFIRVVLNAFENPSYLEQLLSRTALLFLDLMRVKGCCHDAFDSSLHNQVSKNWREFIRMNAIGSSLFILKRMKAWSIQKK